MSRTFSGNAIVIQGTEQDGVFPLNREETLKEIVLDGRREPFEVRGGVYSQSLAVVGSGVVRGPLLAGESLRLEVSADGMQRFLSGVSARGSIVATPTAATEIERSPAASAAGVRFLVRGDVTSAEKVVLRNTLVIGSVSAPEVQLRNSIVLGSVFAHGAPGNFQAICSTFGMYEVRRIIIEGPTTLVLAGGVSEQPPELVDHQEEGGTRYPFRIRLLPLCRFPDVGCGVPDHALQADQLAESSEAAEPIDSVPGLSCEYWLRGRCRYASGVQMRHADFVCLRTKTKQEDDKLKVGVVGSPRGPRAVDESDRWFLGTQSRALHLEQLATCDSRFQDILHRIFAYEHLPPHARTRLLDDMRAAPSPATREQWRPLSSAEIRLFDLATRELEGVL